MYQVAGVLSAICFSVRPFQAVLQFHLDPQAVLSQTINIGARADCSGSTYKVPKYRRPFLSAIVVWQQTDQ